MWVWQGGPREMDTDEVLGILDVVGRTTRFQTSPKDFSSISERAAVDCSTTTRRRSAQFKASWTASSISRGSGRKDPNGILEGRRHSRAGNERTRQVSRQDDRPPLGKPHPVSGSVPREPGALTLRRAWRDDLAGQRASGVCSVRSGASLSILAALVAAVCGGEAGDSNTSSPSDGAASRTPGVEIEYIAHASLSTRTRAVSGWDTTGQMESNPTRF